MITVSVKPLIKIKIVCPAEALCDFLKGNTNDLTIQMFLFFAKISIIVWYWYNKYEPLSKTWNQKSNEVQNLVRTNGMTWT